MGSPLGPLFANIFLSHYESEWLLNSPVKPFLYKKDLLTASGERSFNVLKQFKNYHRSIRSRPLVSSTTNSSPTKNSEEPISLKSIPLTSISLLAAALSTIEFILL